ncbi:hypothetical protein EJ04DRAFT_566324 [Polyplosphaeria fusca]|uniref:Uncharacterized protein n=1 Tax=Polyplosphaeria fusca TaxID=682080 RepID=A0A9P4QVU6_9PLEO|nr:hypothetical protein EJ04DRAFT_566324 [Polyplosphaeria fusca]
MPTITPAPELASANELEQRDGPDAVSLAYVLLTAIPASLRQIAATNLPAVSSILWSEFLDDNRPDWFEDLPDDIQSYLVSQFGPKTAQPSALSTDSWVEPSWTNTWWSPSSSEAVESSNGDTSETAMTSQQTETTAAETTEATDSATMSESTASTSSRTIHTSGLSLTSELSVPSASPVDPLAPDASSSSEGLSRQQKIGIGVGVPLAIAGAAAVALACCFLLRRQRRKSQNGSQPPSSPGFIPRFSFQEKPADDLEHRPLNHHRNNSFQDMSGMTWDDDVIEPMQEQAHTKNGTSAYSQPIVPALFHTHSSNRARGKRTSYSSLHSVAEVTEPDENPESPILGRHASPRGSPIRPGASSSSPRRPSVIVPPIPTAATVKRKPVGSPPHQSPAAQAASDTLMRQTMGHNNQSPSSAAPFGNRTTVSSISSPYASPTEEHDARNPFSNNYSYVEDYGPEFNGGYVDVDDGLYGGHTSLSRYPEPKAARSDWPLRGSNNGRHKRNKSPLWDRVYEG